MTSFINLQYAISWIKAAFPVRQTWFKSCCVALGKQLNLSVPLVFKFSVISTAAQPWGCKCQGRKGSRCGCRQSRFSPSSSPSHPVAAGPPDRAVWLSPQGAWGWQCGDPAED